MSIMNLKGIAISKYGSCSKFAEAMGWNRNKAARILNQEQSPSLQDVSRMVVEMNIPTEDIVPIFFGTMFTE